MGSEMCIRDRDWGRKRLPSALRKMGFAYVAETAVGAYPVALSCNCLLYTSDAADDLLCVDLGGRRTIKKKKKII